MKKILVFTGALFAMNALADCGLHISKLDSLVKDNRKQIVELKKLSEEKNINLRLSDSELQNGDFVINNLFHPAKDIIEDTAPITRKVVHVSYYGNFSLQDEQTGRIYDNTLIVAQLQHGQLIDVDTQELKFRIKYKQMEKKYGSGPAYRAISYDLVKKVISEFKGCSL